MSAPYKSDPYMTFTQSPMGSRLTSMLKLPVPPMLTRYQPNQPLTDSPVHVVAPAQGDIAAQVRQSLKALGILCSDTTAGKYVVFDASGITEPGRLVALWEYFNGIVGTLASCGRVVILGRAPELAASAATAIAQRALEGFVRALAKEIGKGITVNLVYVAHGAETELVSTLRFFLSPRSAYITGQVIRVGGTSAVSDAAPSLAFEPSVHSQLCNEALHGKAVLVTGAAHGIGRATVNAFAREGAHVIGLDHHGERDALDAVMSAANGQALYCDLASPQAAVAIADALGETGGVNVGVDIVVFNAGITCDKRLKNMSEPQWSRLMAINLLSVVQSLEEILKRNLLKQNGRIVCVSSLCGIAGNAGQTNYATSKAGLFGVVESMQAEVANVGGATINSVAPAFINTQMTQRMPTFSREAYRRMNSMNQGGLPEDVAEAILWLADPGSSGVTGQCVRVCGQSWLGA